MVQRLSINGVSFRIKPTDDLGDELDRLARIISLKYKRDVKIILKEINR